MLRAIADWEGGYASDLSDGRSHRVRVDLPEDEGGQDAGTTALELAALSLAGCITTIFGLVAKRRRVPFEGLRVELEADRPRGAPTITRVVGRALVTSSASRPEVETVLDITLRTCPVGVLFHRAGILVDVELVVNSPPVGLPVVAA